MWFSYSCPYMGSPREHFSGFLHQELSYAFSIPSSAVPHPGCGCFGMFRGKRQRNRDEWPYKTIVTTSYLNGLLAFRREKTTTFRSCGPESIVMFFSSHLGMTAMPAMRILIRHHHTQLLLISTIHLGWTHRHFPLQRSPSTIHTTCHTFSSAS